MPDPSLFPRVQVVPDVDRARFLVDGIEQVVFRFGSDQPRPFFYPILGPSGAGLTRVGHPNPVGHEHHKSVWFGHERVNDTNFWSERVQADIRIRLARIVAYQDGADWGALAADLDWAAHGHTLMRQRLIAGFEPLRDGGYALDLQSRFESTGIPVDLGRTNFGFLGVRVAKTISEQFGGGTLTSAEGAAGEPAIFGKVSRWVDYSGPSKPGIIEGICLMDHPANPRHPPHWHVRRDGWMEPAFTMADPYSIPVDHPLDLRYRLRIHRGAAEPQALDAAWNAFATAPAYYVIPARGQAIPAIVRGSTS